MFRICVFKFGLYARFCSYFWIKKESITFGLLTILNAVFNTSSSLIVRWSCVIWALSIVCFQNFVPACVRVQYADWNIALIDFENVDLHFSPPSESAYVERVGERSGEGAGMERGWPHPFETTGGACLERVCWLVWCTSRFYVNYIFFLLLIFFGRKGDRGLAKDRSAFFFPAMCEWKEGREEGRKDRRKKKERKKERKEERMHINFIVFFFFNNYLRTRSIT